MDSNERISFVGLWLDLLRKDWGEKRWKAFIPWRLLMCLFFACLMSIMVPVNNNNTIGLLVKIFTGLATAQGIVLGFSMNSIQQILSNASQPGFSKFLRHNGILDQYLFFVQYFQYYAIFALVCIVFSAVALLTDPSEIVARGFITGCLGLFLSSTFNAADTSVLVRDLIWYRSLYDEKNANSGANKPRVVPISKTQE